MGLLFQYIIKINIYVMTPENFDCVRNEYNIFWEICTWKQV